MSLGDQAINGALPESLRDDGLAFISFIHSIWSHFKNDLCQRMGQPGFRL